MNDVPHPYAESRPRSGGPLTPEEFRALYVENMRKKFEETRQRQAAGLAPTPAMVPRPQETRAAVPPIFRPEQDPHQVPEPELDDGERENNGGVAGQRNVWRFQLPWNVVFQVAFAAFFLSQGGMGASFFRMFAILAVAKLATGFFGRLRLQRNRLDHDNDVRAENERVQLAGRNKVWYMLWKSAVTFFVSVHPSFRVEALEMEVRLDGIDHEAVRRRRAAPLAQ